MNGAGVPQGSILGPLLFLLYINDLPNVTNQKCVLFADDISIVIPDEDKTRPYEEAINSTLRTITHWLNHNNLDINVSKTKYVQFANHKRKPPNLNISHSGELVCKDSSVRFLGILLDENCDWKLHVDMVCKKLNRFVYALKQLRNTANENSALLAYHGYVNSVLRYGLLLWGNSTHIVKAFLTQKKCIRAICGVGPLETCRPLFKKLNVMTLVSLYIFEIGMFVRNHNIFPKVSEDSRYVHRDPTKLKMNNYRSTFISKNCSIMAIKVFNKIPKTIRELPLRLFRVKLKIWLIEQCFYTINDFLNHKINEKFNF